jgi:SAM-dependent methyltransferase
MASTETVSPQMQVMQLLTSKVAAQALTQIAELGIADQLKEGPRTTVELATAAQVHEDALYRVMRALAGVGFFTEQPGRVFANNANSEVLRTDVTGSMRAMARWLGEETSWWKAWGHLSHSVRTGGSAAELALGETAFDFFGKNLRVNEIFQGAMTDFSVATAKAVVEAYDFSGINRIVDVGGGHGGLLSAILSANPGTAGVLYDLPQVIEGADATLRAGGQISRIEKIAGSFLDGVPGNADAYILKHVIHDWDDARCIKLLENCRKGLKPGGRILIVEQVLTDRPESVLAKMLDLEMLVMTPGGRERTEPEFKELLRSAGFEMQRIVQTKSPACVIEAFVAKSDRDIGHPSQRRGKVSTAQLVPA